MEGLNTLQRMLNSMEHSLGAGGPDLLAVLDGLLLCFLLFAIVIAAYGLLYNGRVLWVGMGLLVRLSLISLALTQWPWFLEELMRLGVFLGLLVTGGQLDATTFLDPGALMQMGLKSAGALWSTYQAHSGMTQVFTAIPYLLAWVAYCAAFAVMAYK